LCRKRRSIRSSQLKRGNTESCWGVWCWSRARGSVATNLGTCSRNYVVI
jgi:hypothetical protein